MLFGFTEYHLDRRMRSFALLARQSIDPSVVRGELVGSSHLASAANR
jgi:hypothetical protein